MRRDTSGHYARSAANKEEELKSYGDTLLMNALMAGIKEKAPTTRINREQSLLVLYRMTAIHSMVLRLPDPHPTPRLLSVFRSAAHLIDLLCSDEADGTLVLTRFTAAELFRGVFDKIKKVWSLQSTMQWPAEEERARKTDAEKALARIEVLVSEAMDAIVSDMPDPENPHGISGTHQAALQLTMLLQRGRAARADQPSLYVDAIQRQGSSFVASASFGDLAALTPFTSEDKELLLSHFARRSKLSGWKISSEDLGTAFKTTIPSNYLPPSTPAAVLDRAAQLQAKKTPQADSAEVDESDQKSPLKKLQPQLPSLFTQPLNMVATPRFQIADGYTLGGYQVVLKELSTKEYLTPETNEAFILDAHSRHAWCHPCLISFEGAFCERIPTSFRPAVAQASAESLTEQDDGMLRAPYPSLGIVMRAAPEGFVPLSHLLYMDMATISPAAAVDIVLDVADALQYILFDANDVCSSAVERCWSMISPSNVFVRDRSLYEAREEEESEAAAAEPHMSRRPHRPRYEVLVSPHLHIHDGPRNRWEPHPAAVHRCAYAVCQLLLGILTNEAPYASISDQRVLSVVLAEGVDAPLGFEHVDMKVPPDVAYVIQCGMAIKGNSTFPGYSTLQGLRKDFYRLRDAVGGLVSSTDGMMRAAVRNVAEAQDTGPLELRVLATDDYAGVTMAAALAQTQKGEDSVTGVWSAPGSVVISPALGASSRTSAPWGSSTIPSL